MRRKLSGRISSSIEILHIFTELTPGGEGWEEGAGKGAGGRVERKGGREEGRREEGEKGYEGKGKGGKGRHVKKKQGMMGWGDS
jgi:hypothetical protein